MGGWRLKLMEAVDLQHTLEKVQSGTALDFAHYSLLREAADARLSRLMARAQSVSAQEVPEHLLQLQDACLRVAHLLQSSCLALRRLQLDVQDQCLAREALESQIAYMQACLRRSLASFDESA